MAITKINTPELFDLGSTNTSIQLPSGNTASRPSSPSTGEWRFNTDNNKVEYWDGSAWTTIEDEAFPLPANFPGLNFNTNTYVGNGATQVIDAQFNEAAVFNGVNPNGSVIDLPNLKPFFTQKQTFSVSMWFNTEGVSADNSYLFSDYNSSSYNIFAYITPSGLLKVSNRMNGTSNTFTSSSAYDDSQWYHLVVTNDATSRVVTVYINGSSIGTTNISANSWSTGSLGKLGIGAFYSTSNSRWQQSLKGKIDQVRIFNTEISQQDVTDLYNDETTTTAGVLNFPTGAGCIAAYQLDGDASDVGGTYGGVPTDLGFVGLQFQPDLVWIKPRSYADNNNLFDSIRGATKQLISNNTSAESTQANTLQSFDSNGFTTGPDNNTNVNGSTYVAWCWKAASSDSTNTDGTITSTVRANQDAGFSIVKYVGENGTRSVGHGLSSAPELVFVKSMDYPYNWAVYSSALGNTKYLQLNSSAGEQAAALNVWGYTDPNDSTFTISGSNETGDGGDYIAYCFTSITGYQKIGSYTGNGSTSGPIVETGFEPAFLMTKRTDTSGGSWLLVDNKRVGVGSEKHELFANTTSAESASGYDIAFLSNGFQLETTTVNANANGGTYIYLAIAADAQPAPVLADSFEPVIYTGTGSTQSIDTDFKPDFVWIKERTTAEGHRLYDSIRGATKHLNSENTAVEATNTAGLTSFDTNGFSVGNYAPVNTNNEDYVAWCWKAAGISTINTEGSITSITNANPAAGFSIVKYTAGGTATVGHGLSQAPELIITKNLDISEQWFVYAEPVGTQKFLGLNTTSAATSNSGVYTSIGSSTFTNNISSTSRTYINYCFHSVDSYQKVGSYSGSGAAGKRVYTTDDGTSTGNGGFQPRWLMIKESSDTGNWRIVDAVRNTSDPRNSGLWANLNNAESDSTSNTLDFEVDGFTLQGSGSDVNTLNETYIYLAIA